MNEKNAQVMEALSKDTDFMDKLGQMESIDEIVDALNEAGADVTASDVEQLVAMAEKVGTSGELDAEALDSVSGGSWGWFTGDWARSWINLGIDIGNRIFGKNCRHL